MLFSRAPSGAALSTWQCAPDWLLGELHLVRRSSDLQRLLFLKILAVLDDDNLGASLLLQRLDRLSALADDPGDEVAGDHHLEAGSAAAEVSTTHAAAAAASTAAARALVGDDVVDEVAGDGDGLGRAGEGAEPVRHPLAVLGHLDLAAALGLEPGDLLAAPADDQAHHVVRHHHLVGAHARSHANLVGGHAGALGLHPPLLLERTLVVRACLVGLLRGSLHSSLIPG